jgi:hypothetical protein
LQYKPNTLLRKFKFAATNRNQHQKLLKTLNQKVVGWFTIYVSDHRFNINTGLKTEAREIHIRKEKKSGTWSPRKERWALPNQGGGDQ